VELISQTRDGKDFQTFTKELSKVHAAVSLSNLQVLLQDPARVQSKPPPYTNQGPSDSIPNQYSSRVPRHSLSRTPAPSLSDSGSQSAQPKSLSVTDSAHHSGDSLNSRGSPASGYASSATSMESESIADEDGGESSAAFGFIPPPASAFPRLRNYIVQGSSPSSGFVPPSYTGFQPPPDFRSIFA
jgi:hypothetical protein